MPELEAGSVQLVVTSPPCWCIKDYGEAGKIGFAQTYEEYGGPMADRSGPNKRRRFVAS
jgi:hypothetical protein